MPRRPRLDIPNTLQHVIVRGIERRDIFLDDDDRERFVGTFASILKATSVRCFAWSLLSNHFHLLLMSTGAPISHFMRRLLTSYAVYFNRKYARSGHLFQNRYKSILCEEETYLLELVRYIHLNPLRAGMVTDMAQLDTLRWCGHSVLMGTQPFDQQEVDEILGRFGRRRKSAREKYHSFIADGIAAGRRDELVGGGLKRSMKRIGEEAEEFQMFDERVLGSGGFVEQILQDSRLSGRIRQRPKLTTLLSAVAQVMGIDEAAAKRPGKTKPVSTTRGVFCFLAVRRLGYKGSEAGEVLGVGSAGVSLATLRGEAALRDDPSLEEQIFALLVSNLYHDFKKERNVPY